MGVIPELEVFHAVNGYNKTETVERLRESGLHYEELSLKKYGKLALFLTKFAILKRQVREEIAFVCFVEDDVKFHQRFREYVERQLPVLEMPDVNILRLGDWGEAYVTSLQGAGRIVARIERVGILQNMDNQLRERCGVEAHPIGHRAWSLKKGTNRGDITKSPGITGKEA